MLSVKLVGKSLFYYLKFYLFIHNFSFCCHSCYYKGRIMYKWILKKVDILSTCDYYRPLIDLPDRYLYSQSGLWNSLLLLFTSTWFYIYVNPDFQECYSVMRCSHKHIVKTRLVAKLNSYMVLNKPMWCLVCLRWAEWSDLWFSQICF